VRIATLVIVLLFALVPLSAEEISNTRVRDLLTAAGAAPHRLAALAEKELLRVPDARRVAPLERLLASPVEKLRLYSARELARIAAPNSLPSLLGRILDETSGRVRNAVADGAAKIDRNRTIHWLVVKFEMHGGNITRNHVYVGTQHSFVQDFDVEVAKTAFIADPVIESLQEAAVLDVKVISHVGESVRVVRTRTHAALRRVTGAKVSNRPGNWAKWLVARHAVHPSEKAVTAPATTSK
jgi:hypothetical protein